MLNPSRATPVVTDAVDYYLDDRLRRNVPELLLTRVFVPPALQRAVAAQFLLLDELSELTVIRETGVAMTKMTWWFEEWKRLREGAPRHPVTKSLLADVALLGLPVHASPKDSDKSYAWPKLDGPLSVVAAILQGQTPADRSELQQWLADFAAPLAALEPQQESTPAGESLAAAWQNVVLLGWVAKLPKLSELGRAPWPLDLTAQTQLRRAELKEQEHQSAAARHLWQHGGGEEGVGRFGAGHAGVYLAVAERTVLARATGQPEAGRWRQLMTAWRAKRRSLKSGD